MSRLVMITVFCLATLSNAQVFAHLDSVFNFFKIDRGYILGWEVGTNSQHVADQIRVYDEQGHLITKISLLPLVAEATAMDIDDVAVSPSGTIVVAATYSRGPGTFPSSILACLDLTGKLRSAVALLPSRQIAKLAIDEESNVWTLTESATRKDPTTVPLLVEYDSAGNVLRELLKRSQFPAEAEINREDIGFVGFGYESGRVWSWSPGSQDLVTVNVSSGAFTKVHTGLPKESPMETSMGTYRDGENIVSLILGKPDSYSRGTWGIFRWSHARQRWSKIQPVACGQQNALMRYLENGKGVFAQRTPSGGMDLCSSEF